jgi:hypothetical protein
MSHNQGGYSESSIATGSVLFLRKFRPFNGVPAGTDDSTTGDSILLAFGLRPWPIGEIDMGVVNGCLALEGVEEGSDVCAEALTEEELVMWRRGGGGGILELRDARRRQLRQIIMG